MSQADYNTSRRKSQEKPTYLVDKDERGRVRPWHLYKLSNAYISLAYEQVNMNKSERLTHCAETLLFCRSESGKLRLKTANFCRVRLCPLCAWRRSLKTQAHMHKILTAAEPQRLKYMMITLTLRNCSGYDLSKTLDVLISGFKKLTQRARTKSWVGWYRGVEITHNTDNDTYHPHIHALVAVKPSYFKSADYIKQAELTELWRSCCSVDYTPIVDVRKVYTKEGVDSGIGIIKAVAEVAKYTTKSGDIINYDDWDMTVDTVSILDNALDKRRLVAFGGLFKQLHKELNLDDVEDGDLLHIDDTDTEDCERQDELIFFWHSGYNRYVKA